MEMFMDTDRNLRLAVLALEQNLIDPQQLAEVCTQWGSRANVPLGELLVAGGLIDLATRTRLETLLDAQQRQQPAATQAFLDRVEGNAQRTLDNAGVTLDASDAASSPGEQFAANAEDGSSEPRYTISRLHAEGGIGRIWLARDSQLHREVALKTLRPELLSYARVCSRFLQEAQITGQLEHPGIVPVYEIVRQPNLGQVSYAMRFVRGQTLLRASIDYHERRKSGTADPLGLVTLLSAFVAVCHTVAYAHSRGVVHRDLKGENILLGDFGEVIVLDWGVAKLLGETADATGSEPITHLLNTAADRTIDGDVVGTPAYMAPEQAAGRGDLTDHRTDIYGLGAILYELLTGAPPFAGTNTIEVLDKVIRGAPAAPSALWPEVPVTLEAICQRALSKEPSLRHASAIALAQEVQTWQEVQRRQAEEALRTQGEILQSILDTMGEGLIVADQDGKLMLVNPAARQLFGSQPADATIDDVLNRRTILMADRVTLCPPSDLPLSCALRGETVDDVELFVGAPDLPDGRWLSASARPLRDASDTVTGALLVVRDVTDRKLAEEEVRRSRERFELAVQGSQDGLWDWDLQTDEVFFSPRWKSILGYQDHEIQHHIDEWDRRLHPDERERVLGANYAHINGNTPHYEYEYRLRHKDGTYRWILARGVALRDAEGKAYRMAGSHVDITDWKQLEQDLRESQQRYRDLVHERRTP
jgi:PAS domain S-box-containing protein